MDLKQTTRFTHCIEEVADRYDIVLIDSAPILPVADTLALARCAGTVLAVARYGDTSEGELVELQARLARVGASLDGVLINGMQYDLQSTRYGHYGMDGYGKVTVANTNPSA
jgi:tyrosine-protein kinase Etk/Wzc